MALAPETHNCIYLPSRAAWREWPASNHSQCNEVWLIYPNKNTGKDRVPYNEAVEEALCFGCLPSDILAALKTQALAWQFFNQQPEYYRRIRVGYIDEVRKNAPEFQKRLDNFIKRDPPTTGFRHSQAMTKRCRGLNRRLEDSFLTKIDGIRRLKRRLMLHCNRI